MRRSLLQGKRGEERGEEAKEEATRQKF